MSQEIKNAKQMPKVLFCKHMQAGVVGYENEVVLVETDTMQRIMPTFAGKPVYVEHQRVDLERLQHEADGYVVDCFYNELDGWLWSKIIVVSDAGQQAVADGWKVSNAYLPLEW